MECDLVRSIGELKSSCAVSNKALLKELREDELAPELMRLTCEDAALGRMSQPIAVEQSNIEQLLLHPRFSVQQDRPEGGLKVRAIDHMSWGPRPPKHEARTQQCAKKARKVQYHVACVCRGSGIACCARSLA